MSGYSTTDTFASLKDEVVTMLQGYGVNNDQMATLTAAVNDSVTQIPVAGEVSRGVIEIDEELMWVESSEGGLATLSPWGRGFKGTAKAAHAANSPIYVAPTYPRSVVAREINNTVRAVYPALFAVKAHSLTMNPTNWQYELPEDTDRIVNVEWSYYATGTPNWEPIIAWEMLHFADPTQFPSGKAIAIGQPLLGTLRILYATQPVPFTSDEDTLSDTGLPASARDVIVLGAASRLLPWLDTGRLPSQTVSADLLDSKNGIGSAVAVGKEMRAQYTRRLQEEQAALHVRYPTKVHKVR